MKIAIFGLSVTSSWGNGHATLWRGLLRALAQRGHHVTFFERDVPWYAQHRDLTELAGVEIVLYPDWPEIATEAGHTLRDCDAGVVTSYCPDAQSAADLVCDSRATPIFYDLDAPVTLHRLSKGEAVEYVPRDGYRSFELVFSYTGGRTLAALVRQLGARRVLPLYGSVDPAVHFPAEPKAHYRGDLSYLGTWAADRQEAVERLLIEPARRLPDNRFVIGGAMYDSTFPWTKNIYFFPHVPPPDHPAFYCSSRATLNVTREAMASYGWCPSGRLFEAAACGVPIVTDVWDGIETFFTPGKEIVLARTSDDVIAALSCSPGELRAIGESARDRALADHTAEKRALDFEQGVAAARTLETTGAGA